MPTTLADILSRPIRWHDWTKSAALLAFLSDLQANVLKGHGRDHTANIFLSFDGMPPDKITELLQALSFLATSALEQLRAAEAFKATNVSGGRVVCVMLSRGGYEKLGASPDEMPSDAAFLQGMRTRGRLPTLRFETSGRDFPGINDPPPSEWESGGAWTPGNPEPDAMVLVADDDDTLVRAGIDALEPLFARTGATVLGTDIGLAQRRVQTGSDPKGEGIEHFGYVDGRSQPLFLEEDIVGETQSTWSAVFDPSQFIVPDPAECTEFSAGSYFVYRKLEQDVARFKAQEKALAQALQLPKLDEERAGALVVGRFEDGTPAVLQRGDGLGPVNDFNYGHPREQDPATATCPFKAHIRKTNPRDDGSRKRLMARRGITYGERQPRPDGADFAEDDRPSGGVGLIFMAYMADLSQQFEFTQSAWANNPDFQKKETGIDGVIGEQPNRPGTRDTVWTEPHTGASEPFDFKTCIRLIGGGYFFAPSISFLQRGLASAQAVASADPPAAAAKA